MTYSPKFTISSKILENVGLISAAREVIDNAPLVPAWERRFRLDARARIIHHGTHLEGNNLNLEEVESVLNSPTEDPTLPARDRDIQEVINYRAVMDYIDTLDQAGIESGELLPLSETQLKEIHAMTVARILPEEEAGQYRKVKVVIRNTTTGEITFRPPPPIEVPALMDELFEWINSPAGRAVHPLIRAGILHYELVRIHPFTDGNGRTSRAMALLLLFLERFKVKKFFALEDYYDSHPGQYYDALKSVEIQGGDLTNWLEYFILGIAIEFNRVKVLVQKLSLDLKLKNTFGGKQIALSDRQIKLVEYLEKHGTLTMAEGRDLLPDVSDDTVLRDLRDLVDKKLITRKGATKGARYYLKGGS
jgi:Fic family protein